MSALVLKKFKISYDITTVEDDLVHVIGRQSGLLGFLLSLAKIDPIMEMKLNSERIEFRKASFFGESTLTAPITAITGIVGGYTKPKELFFTTIIFAVLGLILAISTKEWSVFIIGELVAAISFVMYVLKKELSLSFQNGGDNLWGLTFKRSIIENVPIDSDKVNEAVKLINDRVLAIHRK